MATATSRDHKEGQKGMVIGLSGSLMKHGIAADHRKARRLVPRFVSLGIGALFCIGIILLIRYIYSPAPFRQTLVVVDTPVRVISFDTKRSRVTAVDIPLDTVMPAAFGYGKYAMGAIITLDEIDHRGGELIVSSVSNALGLPAAGLRVKGEGAAGVTTITTIRHIFSLRSLVTSITDRSNVGVSWLQWARLVFMVATLSSDAVRTVDISPAIITMTSPDGNDVPVLDESRVDYILDDAFFDADIREENISVAVYNATQIPAVGQRASRMLTRMGMQLVYVGNVEKEIHRCMITGEEQARKSITALFIQTYFHCEKSNEGSVGRETGADLEVLVGADFAGRYQ